MADTLSSLVVNEGSKREHFRRGQGLGSGNGKTAGKGQKGQGAHAHTKKHGFEGGQMPLARRLPKFGFKNLGRTEYAIVNLEALNKFEDGTEVTETMLIEKGLVKDSLDGIKILSKGVLSKKLTVKAHAFSASAKKAIEDKGGTAEVIK
ncbi:MAG: 50S ribosomal protein L15 [Bacilli bacterium]|jgi:large subunit ribosomal protein L15|nr:50S ribosomal protein L15 [Bacilli bacterium]MCH4210895.1 50S ribosomal protein L15 [Bacilli bacterium]MCH4228126.1 50S ribosomal protein L15 [Bacilli bacterium]MCI2054568.1 50S ribosomal protein L15 [Bacilli bacterium]